MRWVRRDIKAQGLWLSVPYSLSLAQQSGIDIHINYKADLPLAVGYQSFQGVGIR